MDQRPKRRIWGGEDYDSDHDEDEKTSSKCSSLTGHMRRVGERMLVKSFDCFAYSGPFGHFLHKLMDKLFKGKKGNKTVAKKVILEQLTNSPWNNFLFVMYYGMIIEGVSDVKAFERASGSIETNKLFRSP